MEDQCYLQMIALLAKAECDISITNLFNSILPLPVDFLPFSLNIEPVEWRTGKYGAAVCERQ